MATTTPISNLTSLVEQFVAAHQGEWNHDDWELLLADAAKLGYPFDQDECKRNLGNVLEGLKYFYLKAADGAAPAAPAPAKKRAPGKKKA